jgi:hypothetical protein
VAEAPGVVHTPFVEEDDGQPPSQVAPEQQEVVDAQESEVGRQQP